FSTALDVVFICSTTSSVTKFTANCLFAKTLFKVSLFLLPVRTVENITCGGSSPTTLKNEKGARLLIPFSSTVEIQPIGRGMTKPVNNLYKIPESVSFTEICIKKCSLHK